MGRKHGWPTEFSLRRAIPTLPTCTLVGLLGCSGEIGEWHEGAEVHPGRSPESNPGAPGPGSAPGSGGAAAGAPTAAACQGRLPAGPPVFRRLGPEEYANTARDILGRSTADPRIEPPAGPIISELEVEKLNLAAADLTALKGHHAYVPCDVAGAHDPGCADRFIQAFGRVAFRRPLEEEERAALKAVYDRVRQLTAVSPPIGFREAIDTVAQVILQAPQHVYVHEVGVVDARLPAGTRRLSGHERASRLSYLLWSTTPDRALMEAADKGLLDTADGVRAQAERLLASPRARKNVRRFASHWLELDGTEHHPPIEEFEKNPKRFPFDSAALRMAIRAESEALYERVFFEQGGSWRRLMLSIQAYVTGALAKLYGVAEGPRTATESAWVELDPTRRAGLFTRAAFLSLQANADQQSPVLRGTFIVRHALCLPLPDPPPDVDNTPPMATSHTSLRTVRDLIEVKTQGGTCTACHQMINPIGYTLENYDAMGRWQTHDTGTIGTQSYMAPVNSTATITATDLAGEVMGGVGLSQRLADSAMARSCVVDRWFERALAREPGEADACLLDGLKERFKRTDDMRDLVITLASSDAALFIKEAAR